MTFKQLAPPALRPCSTCKKQPCLSNETCNICYECYVQSIWWRMEDLSNHSGKSIKDIVAALPKVEAKILAVRGSSFPPSLKVMVR